MGRAPCCDKKNGLKKGPWTPEEDQKLIDYIQKHGYGNWRTLPKNAGLQRCGKSCRLRWTNYLRPDIKRGKFSFEEEETIIHLHSILGNKWSAIASRLPRRTDNEIKNYWNTHIRKRLLRMGIDPVTHTPRLELLDLSSIVLTSSLYGSFSSSASQKINIQRILSLHPLVNPEILSLQNINNCPQVQNQNQNQNFVQYHHHHQDSVQQLNNPYVSSLSSLTQPQQLVEPNVNTYPSSFTDHLCYQQHPHQITDNNWLTNDQIAASLSTSSLTEDYNIPQLSSYNNYYSSDNSNPNFRFGSVMSTPSSSPTTLNSAGSTYINGSSTEDERESYESSNILKFEIPDVLDLSEFM